MGEVYRAVDTYLGRTVALKLLPDRFVADPDRLQRFHREARAASALNHPNIVTIFDAGVSGQTPWIAMELVEGRTLRSILHDGIPSPELFRRIAVQTADGLARAHVAGIVHRDLKPENIMVTASGLVKILDFGLAKLAAPISAPGGDSDETLFLTQQGVVAGTPGYMSPEQIAGRAVDYRSDQFALGAILYEMVAGANPFRRDSGPQTIAATLESNPKPLRDLNPQIAPPLAGVIARCLSKDPEARWASTAELVTALETGGEVGQQTQDRARLSRRSTVGIAAAALCLIALTGAAYSSWTRHGQRTQTPDKPVVAVRTFRNLSVDKSSEYFTNGVAEEIRGQLSKISSIRLLSRSAVDRYKDGENRTLGADLKATRIVEGTVRIDNGRLRISVQLMDPGTEQTIWAEQFDRTMKDMLGLQGDVALQIASALQAQLTPDERRRLVKRSTDNMEAYDLVLRAGAISYGDQSRFREAMELLKKAVELDPRYSEAMAMMAYRCVYTGDAAKIEEGQNWARRALEVDPDSVLAHNAMAVAWSSKGMPSKARISFLRAAELDPNNNFAMSNLGSSLLDLGQYEEALHWLRVSVERNPAGGPQCAVVVEPVIALGDFQGAAKWMDFCRQRHPNDSMLPLFTVTLLLTQHKLEEAFEQARLLKARFPARVEYLSAYADLAVVLGKPDAESSFRQLGRESLDPQFAQGSILPESPRTRLAWFALKKGDSAAAEQLLRDAEAVAMGLWDNGVESPLLPVELAAIHSLRGNNRGALLWLQKSYERGWRRDLVIAVDPMLAGVRNDPACQQLMARMKADVLRMGKESTELRELFAKTMPSMPKLRP